MVRTVEDAAVQGDAFDYVLVCIKALPDIYKLGEVIQSVITPSHTCIVLNTTTALDIENDLMEMYPRNMVLSLCSGVDIAQTGPADFDHTSNRDVRIGALRPNAKFPKAFEQDTKESLILTLGAGGLTSTPTDNIEKYQWERLIEMIAFHPISVILKEPSHAKLMEDKHTGALINNIILECLRICEHRKITFPFDFQARCINAMVNTKEAKSTMYQDFLAGRPLEIEVYLATPIRFAEAAKLDVPYLKSTYALLAHINRINQQTPASPLPQSGNGRLAPQRTGQTSMGSSRPYINRNMTDGAAMNSSGRSMSMVYGPPPQSSTFNRPPASQPRRHPSQLSRQNSLEGLEEFASIALYPDTQDSYGPDSRHQVYGNQSSFEMNSTARLPPRASTSQGNYAIPSAHNGQFRQASLGANRKTSNIRAPRDIEDDEDDYGTAPLPNRGPPVDPDTVDMLAMTRRGRKSAISSKFDADRANSFAVDRPRMQSSRSSSQALMSHLPNARDVVNSSALFGMGDNRYGTVDSRSLVNTANSRLNSMQSVRHPSMTATSPQNQQGYSHSMYRQPGPPNAMNGRGPYSNTMPYRNPSLNNASTGSFRGQIPPPVVQRQHLSPQALDYPVKGPGGPPGTRSVTGSASASFGSLGNGSGSHSSSSSREEVPPQSIPR